MNRRRWLLLGFTVIVGTLVALYFVATEPVEREYTTDPSGEAASNRLLAAERFYRRMGLNAESVQSLDEPPRLSPREFEPAEALSSENDASTGDRESSTPAGGEFDDYADTVLLSEIAFRRGGDFRDAWLSWTGRGGHLIIPAPTPDQTEQARPWLVGWGIETDNLSEDLPATSNPGGTGITGDTGIATDAGNPDNGGPDSEPSSDSSDRRGAVDEPDATYELEGITGHPMRGLTLARLADSADWVAVDSHNEPVALSWQIDEAGAAGRITMITGTDWLEYQSIAEQQRADLAWDLVARPSIKRPNNLLLVRHGPRRWWFAYVTWALWPGLGTLAFLAVAAARQGGLRFGPPIRESDEGRRSRIEHLRATGRFLWKQQQRDALVGPLRRRLIREFAPSGDANRADLDDEALARRIVDAIDADKLDADPEEVTRWLRQAPEDRASFVELIRILEETRRNT